MPQLELTVRAGLAPLAGIGAGREGGALPSQYDDLVAIGACGYAAISWAAFSINRVNVGGKMTSEEYRTWGNERLVIFRERLKQLGRRQRLRNQQLFTE